MWHVKSALLPTHSPINDTCREREAMPDDVARPCVCDGSCHSFCSGMHGDHCRPRSLPCQSRLAHCAARQTTALAPFDTAGLLTRSPRRSSIRSSASRSRPTSSMRTTTRWPSVTSPRRCAASCAVLWSLGATFVPRSGREGQEGPFRHGEDGSSRMGHAATTGHGRYTGAGSLICPVPPALPPALPHRLPPTSW